VVVAYAKTSPESPPVGGYANTRKKDTPISGLKFRANARSGRSIGSVAGVDRFHKAFSGEGHAIAREILIYAVPRSPETPPPVECSQCHHKTPLVLRRDVYPSFSLVLGPARPNMSRALSSAPTSSVSSLRLFTAPPVRPDVSYHVSAFGNG